MLSRFDLLIPILSAWMLGGIIYGILHHRSKFVLPPGSVMSIISKNSPLPRLAGQTWSRALVFVGMGITEFILVFVLILTIFDYWGVVAPFITIDLPQWVNWLGMGGFLLHVVFGTFVVLYNPNYTPVNRALSDKYILATGGPYAYIRHPMYVNKAILVIFLFLATGIWFVLFGLISWIALPNQARAEEYVMTQRFGDIYRKYIGRTGRFFPRFRQSLQNQ